MYLGPYKDRYSKGKFTLKIFEIMIDKLVRDNYIIKEDSEKLDNILSDIFDYVGDLLNNISDEDKKEFKIELIEEEIIFDSDDKNQFFYTPNLESWARKCSDKFDMEQFIKASYYNMFDISDSVDEKSDWIQNIKEFLNSEVQYFDNGIESEKCIEIEFGEKLALVYILDPTTDDDDIIRREYYIITREEGIEFALENGIDIKELKDY